MPKPPKGIFGKCTYYFEYPWVFVPLLALTGTALLNWTMRSWLEPNLFIRLLKLVGLPIWIFLVLVAPPLVIAWCISYICRRSNTVFAVVFYVLLFVWGFWYLIPPIIENWDEFLRFIDDFGAV